MNKLYMMIGLPGSGKSTYAKKIMRRDKNCVMVSSDGFREVLLQDIERQDENNFIFKSMQTIAVEGLKRGKNVIYDATNINEIKRRILAMNIRNEVDKPIEVVGVYCMATVKEALSNNARRDRRVPQNVIEKMAKNFDIPTARDCYLDDIEYYYFGSIDKWTSLDRMLNAKDYEEFNGVMKHNIRTYENCVDLSQDCPYHTLSVSRHIYSAFRYAQKNIPDDLKGRTTEILYALAFHDVGKALCKNFHKGSIYANFFGHEKVSAQVFLGEAARIESLAESATIDTEFIAALIKEHGFPYENKDKETYDKALAEIAEIYGNDFMECLKFMRVCDMEGK